MGYVVKETFYTLQGEGARTGRAAVFCRFVGCNLWSGREVDRAEAACRFCDTDFVGTDGIGGGRFDSAAALAAHVAAVWVAGAGEAAGVTAYVVFTGGEPTLQLDAALCEALHARGFEIAIETNGTRPVPAGVDWICVSPKPRSQIVQRRGDELKLVYPQPEPEVQPAVFAAWDFAHFFLQPLDDARRVDHTTAAARYCLSHPRWRLSLQTHKLVGLP